MKRYAADLTALDATFLEELLKTPTDHSGAFRRACVALNRPLPKGLADSAHAILHKPRAAEAWEEMKRTRAMRVQVTTDMVLEDLWGVLQVDATQFTGADGYGMTLDEYKALTKYQRRAIKSVSRKTMTDGTVRIRVEIWNREKLIELAGKHTGAWAKGEQLIVQGNVQQNNVVYVIGVPEKSKDANSWAKEAQEWTKKKLSAPR